MLSASATTTTAISPTERAWAGVIGDLMQRFREMYDKSPPSPGRILRWTLCAGRDPAWVESVANDLRRREKAGLPVTQDEFNTWKHSIQQQMTRPSLPGESLSDWYDRLRRLHGFEFPTYKEEPFWRWKFESVRDFVFAGHAALFTGISGSGKSAATILCMETIKALKDEQVAIGWRSTLGQMLGKHVGRGGTPDSPPDPDSSHLGLWYARRVRFISNQSAYDDPENGLRSPIADSWSRRNKVSGVLLDLADVEEGADYAVIPIDEAGIAADKFAQGAERVKTLVGMTRGIRGFNACLIWMTQYGAGDLPKEIVLSTQTRWVFPPPRGEKARGKATITVPGSPLHEREVTGIPLPVSGFDTKDKPTLDSDISFAKFLASISAQRERVEREERRIWTREDRARSIRRAVYEQLEPNRTDPDSGS